MDLLSIIIRYGGWIAAVFFAVLLGRQQLEFIKFKLEIDVRLDELESSMKENRSQVQLYSEWTKQIVTRMAFGGNQDDN